MRSPSLLVNPPGGVLIWLFVFVELIAFGLGLFALAYSRNHESELFFREQKNLNFYLGLLLTFLLLTSGWLIAESVHSYFKNEIQKAKWQNRIAILFGILFILIKFYDFRQKLQGGLSLGLNTFWDYYWLLTGFHFIHVIIGLSLLLIVQFKIPTKNFEDEDFAMRGSGLF